MAVNDPSRLPRLSAGRIDVLLACPRRLAGVLDPDPDGPRAARQHDGPFRLRNALRIALHDAHRAAHDDGVPVGDVLDERPPSNLSVEEAAVFRRAVAAYVDAMGDDGATYVDVGLDALRADGPGGGYLLTGEPFLVVRGDDDVIELRNVHLGSDARRRFGTTPRTADVVNARLVLKQLAMTLPRATNDRLVRVANLALRPHAELWHTEVTVADLDHLRNRILSGIDDAAREVPEARPGNGCVDCTQLVGCPAIAQDRWVEVLARFERTDTPTPRTTAEAP